MDATLRKTLDRLPYLTVNHMESIRAKWNALNDVENKCTPEVEVRMRTTLARAYAYADCLRDLGMIDSGEWGRLTDWMQEIE